MLRRIRARLRRIEYYSARRTRTAWTTWMNVALFASPLAAIVTMLVAAIWIETQETAGSIRGDLGRGKKGGLVAVELAVDSMQFGQARLPPRFDQLAPVGEFELQVVQQWSGWPLFVYRHPPRESILIDLYINAGSGPDEMPAELVEECRHAVERLRSESKSEPMQGIVAGLARPSAIIWAGLVLNWGIHMVAVYSGTALLIQVIRFATFQRRVAVINRAEARRIKGMCPACGYDVRGLEFRDRCPECGGLLD